MAPKSAADIQNIVNPPEGLRGEPGQKGMKYNVEHDPVAGGVQGDLSNVERNWREGFKKFHEDYKSATPERRKEIQDAARDAEAVINNMPEGPEKDEAIAGFAASREVLGSFLKGEGVEALKKRAKAHGEYGTASEVGFVAGGYASMYAVAQLHYNSLYTGRYKTVGRMAKPIAQFVGMITPGLNHKALTEIIEARKFLASSEGQKALKWGYNEWLKSLPKAPVEGWARKGMEIPTFEQVVGYDARTATPGRMPKARDLTKSYLGQALH